MSNYIVSLDLTSHAWLPATDPATNRCRPLCQKHLPTLLTKVQKPDTRSTIYRCLICDSCYEVVEVLE